MAPPRRRISMNASPDGDGASRKRTLVISLLALGAGAVSVGNFTGAGSGPRTDTRTYKNITECEAERLLTPAECVTNFQQARMSHEKAAPVFAQQNDCEKEFGAGQCARPSDPSRANTWIPAMAAYLVGRRAAGGYQAAPMFRRPGDPRDEYRLTAGFPAPLPGATSGQGSTTSSRSSFGSRSTSSSSYRTGSTIFTSGRNASPSRSGISTSRSSTSRGGFGSSGRSGGS